MTRRRYRITVAGVLSERFDGAFEPLTLERDAATTVLSGMVQDASALYGVIMRIQDLGLDLVSVEPEP
jgi:hypothetical protein